jgi:hypothetical protein
MRKLACILAASVAFPMAANAAEVILSPTGQPYAEMIHTGATSSGTALALVTKPSDIDVAATTTTSTGLEAGGFGGNGYAIITGGNGTSGNLGFQDITIDPLSPWSYFTAMQFTLTPLTTGAPSNSMDWRFDATVNFLGGGSQTIQDIFFGTTTDKFDALAEIILGDQEYLDSITLFGLEGRTSAKGQTPAGQFADYRFDSIRQISFDAVADSDIPDPQGAVPEPGTWLMMMFGFGAVGAMIRRRKSESTQLRVRFA